MSERWNDVDDLDLLQLEVEMQDELQNLRLAATVYAERSWARGTGVVPVRPAPASGLRRGRVLWIATGVASAVLAAAGVQVMHRSAAPTMRPASAATVEATPGPQVSDEALLDQIQSDLSSGVPAAMEPLAASTDVHEAQGVTRQ